MMFAAALLVGVSIPASVFTLDPSDAASATLSQARLAAGQVDIQSFEVSQDVAPTGAGRDAWSALSWAQILDKRYETRDYSYAPASGSIRWPFPTQVRISDGYGDRVSPCSGCSSFHKGTDFLPGDGAPIYSIADGVVTDRESGGGGFGNYVTITHVIDGVKIESVYAHMQTGSSPLQLGQSVVVGEFIGLTGDTGASTGPHLHLEIKVEGRNVDPFAWLQANAR